MKRFLSLTLVAIMLLTTLSLTSCDLSAIFGGGTTTTPPEAEIRTTITELEWRKVYTSTNYELTLEAEDMKISVISSDTAMYVDYMGLKLFVDPKTGAYISESEAGYVGMVMGESMLGEDMSLGGMGLFPTIEFSELVYDEQRKVYTYKNEDAIGEFQFEDGKLVYATVVPADTTVNGMFEIKNVGTTVLELPEYNNLSDGIIEPSKAGKDVVTTITDEQLSSLFEKNNFTLKANVIVIDIYMKVTENATESSMSLLGMGGSPSYSVLIDGEWYDLQEDYYTGGYLAKKAEEGSLIGNLSEFLTLDKLTYNSDGRYYEYKDEEIEAYFYFENGSLVQFVVCSALLTEDKTEVIFTISDIGTTKVDLPEYTVYFDPNALTEEQWNELMACKNFTAEVNGYDYISGSSNAAIIEINENGYVRAGIENIEYFAFENGAVYHLVYDESTDSYVGELLSGATPDMCTIGTLLDLELDYSDLIYDSYTGTYYYLVGNEEETIYCTYTFEDGQLASVYYSETSNDGSTDYYIEFIFTGIGTTVVEIPEYTVAE